jgi:hypothetical protein
MVTPKNMRYILVSKSFLEYDPSDQISTLRRLVGPDSDTIYVCFHLKFGHN